ncbi:MAG: hypothetical protein CML07_08330 [Psychrobacter sp.]|nr:hypothetical protein [Psychrobacter sp.]
MNDSCYDCAFWSPGEMGGWREESFDLPGFWESETMPGQCRFRPPSLGEVATDQDGEPFTLFGQWPKTMACDWCGRFKQRQSERQNQDKAM